MSYAGSGDILEAASIGGSARGYKKLSAPLVVATAAG
jgi:hypothetical protein